MTTKHYHRRTGFRRQAGALTMAVPSTTVIANACYLTAAHVPLSPVSPPPHTAPDISLISSTLSASPHLDAELAIAAVCYVSVQASRPLKGRRWEKKWEAKLRAKADAAGLTFNRVLHRIKVLGWTEKEALQLRRVPIAKRR